MTNEEIVLDPYKANLLDLEAALSQEALREPTTYAALTMRRNQERMMRPMTDVRFYCWLALLLARRLRATQEDLSRLAGMVPTEFFTLDS